MTMNFSRGDGETLGNLSSGYGRVYQPFGYNDTGWVPPDIGGGGTVVVGGSFIPGAPDPLAPDVIGPIRYFDRANTVAGRTSTGSVISKPAADPTVPPATVQTGSGIDSRTLIFAAAGLVALLIITK